ncbi:ABC transporter substrate-binding protein [Paenibacillus sp. ACRRX]|uniref:ABC transporter substrate-binding protein n=1 Tax=Paenibacillus sp. ACRRX TaxID=2918206 RepID=UPI001EF6C18F|nr:ABC transporter substrate-binding protein [Paenibacillus sp. ACRRX]MCG7409362.1 ABC transporter substrate-binding protein [Paenibacillus sp. ACRRX]
MFKKRCNVITLTLGIIVVMSLTACNTSNSVNPEPVEQINTENAQGQDGASGKQTKPETRVVSGEFGDVTIPTHPQRVAGIYVEDYLKALDVTPVVQWYHPSWGKQDYLQLDVPQFDITGSIEALLEQSPDLIILDGGANQAQYEQYSKVAPTYRIKEEVLEDSTEILKSIADALGIPEKAEKVLKDYRQKVEESKAKLQKTVGKEKVAVIRLNVADKSMALFGVKNRYTGVIYKEFGLEPVPMAANMTDYHVIVSEEVIPQLEADHIIVFPANGTWDDAGNQEAYNKLNGPLWKNIPAIKNGKVYKMDRTHWQSGAITANSMKLDDLLRYMVK